MTIHRIGKYARKFLYHVKENPQNEYLLTEVGCGLAGLQPEDIAPLFEEGKDFPNIVWPERFAEVLM